MSWFRDPGPLLIVVGLTLAAVGWWLSSGQDAARSSGTSGTSGTSPSGTAETGPNQNPAAEHRSWFGWFGNLPGDVRYESSRTRVYFPITSMLVVSAILTLLFQLRRLF